MQKFTHVKQLGIEEPCFKIVTNRMFKDALTTQIRVNAKQKEIETRKKSENDEDYYVRALKAQLDMETLVEDFLIRTFKLDGKQKAKLENLPQDKTGELYQSTLVTIQGINLDEQSDEKADDTKSTAKD